MTWSRLAELAAREKEVVEAERWEELLALQAEREGVIASLNTLPPRELRGVLEAARERSLETEAALGWALAETGRQLAALSRGRRAVTGYALASGSASPPPSV